MSRAEELSGRSPAVAVALIERAFSRRSAASAIGVGGLIASLMRLEAERRRLFVWLPVFFMIGILAYFAADREPSLWPPLTVGVFLAFVAIAARDDWRIRAAAVAVGLIFLGFSAAVMRTASVATPVLPSVTTGTLRGFVESVEERTAGSRIVVVPTAFSTLESAALPYRVRVTSRTRGDVKPGDFISATVRLLAPPEPARPGGYDFARDAFFRSIGAVGSVSGAINIATPPHQPSWRIAFNARIDAARNALTRRIVDAFGGQAGAVAAALVTGKRGQIAEETNEALRAAGIYHIVSISGLHMVLAAGAFFWTARAVLALFPSIALGWPVKKIAALVGMAGATAYCVFSGSEVATERSLIMTLVMLGAILVDRPALSMRNLAIAALIVLAREPESMLGPSFQMSFAAVAGLIAFCERPREEFDQPRPRNAPLGPLLRGLRLLWRGALAIVLTTCIATVATSPFSAYHFQTLNPLGILGNALALPFISLAIMPAAVIGVMVYPFGLDWPVWWLMGLATQPVLAAARAVAGLEQSTVMVPTFGAAALAFLVLAILWVTIWSTAIRWLAIVPALIGMWLASIPERADGYIDRTAQGAAVRGADGRLVLLGRPSVFVAEQWLRADGDRRKANDPSLRTGAACDQLGCVVRLEGGAALAYVTDRGAFEEDCRRAAIVVSRLPAPSSCKASVVLDRDRLTVAGAAKIVRRPEGFVIVTARDPNVSRPWLRPIDPKKAPPVQSRESGAASQGGEAPMEDPDARQ